MKLGDLSVSARQCLAVFEAFNHPLPTDTLKVVFPHTTEELPVLVDQLTQHGWLKKDGDDNHVLSPNLPRRVVSALKKINTPDRINEMIDALQAIDRSEQIDPELLIHLLERSGKLKEAAFLAHKCGIACIDDKAFESAFPHLLKAGYLLKDLQGVPECDRLFVSTALNLAKLGRYLRRQHEDIIQVLKAAQDTCQRLGDERNLALVTLHIGVINHLIYRPDEAFKALNFGLKIVKKLGDDDISRQAAEFFGVYYFLQGLLEKAANYFEQALPSDVYQKSQVFNIANAIYLGGCAAYMGQFYRAVGLLDSYWRRAILNFDKLYATFLQAFLGMVLLMMGKRREAYVHLEAAQKEAVTNDDLWALVLSQRALAYYYYLEGQTEKSYLVLKECLTKAAGHGLGRPLYYFPWMLELLFEYHQRGYNPIPGYAFEHEVKMIIDGKNIHLRGTAFRILAKQAEINGGDPSPIQVLLEKSEADLLRACAPLQLAKTRAHMALLNLRSGHKERALNLALQAWEGLSVHGNEPFPNQLKSLLETQDVIQRSPSLGGNDILEKYLDMMDEIIPSTDPEELLFRLVSSTSRFFQAERGAFFMFDDEDKNKGPVLRTLYNLTEEEVQSEGFHDSLNFIHKAYQKNQAITVRVPQSGGKTSIRQFRSILCLPFDVEGRVVGVLYHDRMYSEGAFDFLDKSTLKRVTQHAGTYIRRIMEYSLQIEEKSLLALGQATYRDEFRPKGIIAESRLMRDLLARADRLAQSEVPVLIMGETGVGKELLARRLHDKSPRKMMPFIPVNLSTIPETLIESELFGHEKGAFTGADHRKPGRMELAHRGTLFIDEIGDIPKSVQIKLLRVLEDKAFYRVGGTKRVSSDFRLITATNRDMVKEVEMGNFREDLYYRLSVVPIIVPPLHQRGNDIILLAKHLLSLYAKKYKRPVPELSFEDKAKLKTYDWPGNVRELKNMIERSVILSSGTDLDLTIPKAPKRSADPSDTVNNQFSDKPTMDELQRRYLKYILKETNGKLTGPRGAAEILGMKNSTLYDRMKKLGVLP